MSEPITLDTIAGTCLLKRSNRKTLGISVLPDGSLELTAPNEASLEDIAEKVKKRRHWVAKQRWEFSQMNTSPPPQRYCTGATHRYLGRQCRLKIISANHSSVKLKGGYFHIHTTDTDDKAIAKLLDQWMRTHAKAQFEKRLKPWLKWCQYRKLPTPSIHLRSMPKRWGSCHPDGRISLNPKLIRTPSTCIDYVIAHEICHLQYPQHNQAFYKLLDEIFPNWKATKSRLENAEL